MTLTPCVLLPQGLHLRPGARRWKVAEGDFLASTDRSNRHKILDPCKKTIFDAFNTLTGQWDFWHNSNCKVLFTNARLQGKTTIGSELS